MESRERCITNASIKFQDALTIVADYGLFLNLFMVCLFCGFGFFSSWCDPVSLCQAKRSQTLTGQFS